MARRDDISSEHFDWLVESRSRNQRSTAVLYRLIERHEPELSQNLILQDLAQNLAAIVFSLWRAVFLSDLSSDVGDQLVDVKKFLQSLIAHNAILYQTDFVTREWTFDYYLDNATFRLERIKDYFDPKGSGFQLKGKTAKDEWMSTQSRLDRYLASFERMFSG